MGRHKYKYNIDFVVEGLDIEDLDSLLQNYEDLKYLQDAIEEKMSLITDRIKNIMKNKGWKIYKEKTRGLSASILSKKKEVVNKTNLKMLLNDEKYNQIIKKEAYTILEIVTRKDRQRLEKYGIKKI